MRLIKAHITGFGRLSDCKVNLDHKVIAIVGPNEAGKTTLLKALSYIDDKSILPPAARSRGLNVTDTNTVVRTTYLLSQDDKSSLTDLNLQDTPTSIEISRKAGVSNVYVNVIPRPTKNTELIQSAISKLPKLLKADTRKSLKLLDHLNTDENKPFSLHELTTTLVASLNNSAKTEIASTAVLKHSSEIEFLRNALSESNYRGPLKSQLDILSDWIGIPDPESEVRNRLYARRPKFLFFSDEDRSLSSEYALTTEILDNVPVALANLTKVAELSLETLVQSITSGDSGLRETLILDANNVLRTKFREMWKQSDVSVYLKVDSGRLEIRIIENGRQITQFEERSAGLRMFIALVMFLGARDISEPPMLLIDEAEIHLHVDAQADLVNSFMKQTQASKIIYTTHSPACLPPDLGSNIRSVLPCKDNEYFSTISGSFWHNSAGFSPLLLAMGAGAAAFSAARFVVLTEGVTEMLLLPSLIKAATEIDDLSYQIAPGISEKAPEFYSEFGLEGARVAYLVDGDKAGTQLKARLIANGIPEFEIIQLKFPTIENLLDKELYLKVVSMFVEESGLKLPTNSLPVLTEPERNLWPDIIETWAHENNVELPGKKAIASRLVEEGIAKPSASGKRELIRIHHSFVRILGV